MVARPTGHTRPAVTAGDRGYALGIAGFITSFFFGLVGLILSAVALHQAKASGKRHPFAFAGLIIGIVRTVLDVLGIVAAVFAISAGITYCTDHPNECSSSSSRDYNNNYTMPDQTAPDKTY